MTPASLSRDEILKAGLRVGVRDGFDALSMRLLARELGVTPMAIYHHVANKEILQQLLIDSVLAAVPIPPLEFGDWQERLLELQSRTAAALVPYPGIGLLVFNARLSTEVRRLNKGYVRVLLDGGFTERQAIRGFRVVYAHALGRYVMETQLRAGNYASTPTSDDDPADVAETWAYWAAEHPAENWEFSNRTILRGLSAMLAGSRSGV